jgi:hypothetical protein
VNVSIEQMDGLFEAYEIDPLVDPPDAVTE